MFISIQHGEIKIKDIEKCEKFRNAILLDYYSSHIKTFANIVALKRRNSVPNQKCVEDPSKHLRWNVLRKYLTAFSR